MMGNIPYWGVLVAPSISPVIVDFGDPWLVPQSADVRCFIIGDDDSVHPLVGVVEGTRERARGSRLGTRRRGRRRGDEEESKQKDMKRIC